MDALGAALAAEARQLIPPKGAAAFETTPTLRPIMPVSRRVDHALAAREVSVKT